MSAPRHTLLDITLEFALRISMLLRPRCDFWDCVDALKRIVGYSWRSRLSHYN